MLKASITGIGMSRLGRNTNRPCIDHLADAALEAIADAGLTRDDIDGLTTYPGRHDQSPGMSPLGCTEVHEALGLKTRWHSSSSEGPAQMSPLMIAAMAVSTGQARHVLCFRALTESSSQSPTRRASVATGASGARLGGWFSYLLPMGALSASNWAAQFARRRMFEFGATREQIGAQCVLQRANAQHNPRALFHGKPLTIEEYLGARMISDPLGMFDCDIPIDGACVIIVSAADAARDLRKPPISIVATSAALDRDSWDQRADLTQMAAIDACTDLWTRTDLKPADVDVAALYDGFSVFVPMWLEAFGFCKRGEGEAFIADGHTGLTGTIPTNTGGGQMSAGRLHGFGHLHEACTQLWGEGGGRQVADARTAVVGMGGGPLAGAMLIQRS